MYEFLRVGRFYHPQYSENFDNMNVARLEVMGGPSTGTLSIKILESDILQNREVTVVGQNVTKHVLYRNSLKKGRDYTSNKKIAWTIHVFEFQKYLLYHLNLLHMWNYLVFFP